MKILTAICALLFSAALMFGQLRFGQGNVRKDAAITAVTGESWLHHLNRSFDETSMGKTWRLGPPDSATEQPTPCVRSSMLFGSTASSLRMETLNGSDLYRLNCRGCHGEYGLGAPPEIGSLIDPVRATSVVLVTQRMKMAGMALSRRETAELVNQSRSVLLKRLHEGGKDMPSFHHLREAEIRSLVAYLNQLAGVPGAEKEQVAIQESHARVGELIVKSTCHVCHDAIGLNPTPRELLDGTIPPLSALPVRVNQTQLMRKVTSGAPVIMGTPASVYRGRMPVFSYLSENEAADVYEYLTQYPPTESGSSDQTAQKAQPDATNPPNDSGEARVVPQTGPARVPERREQGDSVALPIGMGLFAAALLALGCWITLREFKKISVESQARRASPSPGIELAPWATLHPRVELRIDSSSRVTESVGRKSSVMEERKIS
ncbi:MAG: c-type cytochrome [Terriglobales bacterium]|jgi:mono/diheme cytochrome c family protein